MHAAPQSWLRHVGWLFPALSLIVQSAAAAPPPAVIFETDVAPLLKSRCTDCHNPEKRKGELDLSTPEGLLRGGESGPVFQAGDPGHSHLLELIQKGEMPKQGGPLAADQIETIRQWITTGAQFRKPPQPVTSQLTQHDVLPILLLRCTFCHGPRQQEGGLDLRTPAAMRKGGRTGPAILGGNPDASLLIRRIESEACPPQEKLLQVFVKRPPAAEVQTLRRWIAEGAPAIEVQPDVATTAPDPLVADEDRQHWAFQPPKATPGVRSIDEFVLRQLRANGLGFSPAADRDTLIRRAWLDLVGLPPGPADREKWRTSTDSNWYGTMVDQLLASPHYGERWGRYWLDLAGYADSEGGTSADPVRETAWKYRDYVIRAFNEDKPYDRFLLEQIAGDELVDYAKAPVITREMTDNLVATGFLRMGIDETGSRTMNFVPERLGVIADALKVLGSGVMGLTLECVRCHSHKYDPIPHRDYYRLKAVFQGAFDEHDWMSFKTRSLDIATPAQRQRVATINPPLVAELKTLEARLKKAQVDLQHELLRQHHPELAEADRKATIVALKTADNVRTRTQAILVEKYQHAELLPDSAQPEPVLQARRVIEEIEGGMARVRRQMEPPLAIRALWDRGEPSPTYLLRRGEYDQPGRLVGPGVPTVLTDGRTPFVVEPPFPGGTPKTGRRLAFARWLTQPAHPLTARVMVNRIWHHHFGAGLVRSLENFGVKGDRPTHPELLDWLALEFVRRGWSIKEMHRLIMNSQTYRQASRVTGQHLKLDPQNQLLSRMPLQRMDAEALRDTLLFVAGKLDHSPGGPPDQVTVQRDGLVSINPTSNGTWRRSIYAQYRRTELPTMMDTFDYPEMGPNCVVRTVSTVSPQSLMLLNNGEIRELAAALATRVENTQGGRPDPNKAVEAVYQIALTRLPTAREKRLGVEALAKLQSEWPGEPHRALETYCHTIFNSAAFLYID